MTRKIIYYGIIAGVFLTVYVTMLDASEVIYNTSWGAYLGYLAIIILPVCIFLTLRELSRSTDNVLIAHSLLAGLCVAFLAATMYCSYTFIDLHFFDGSHLRNLFNYTSEQMLKNGNSAEEVNARLESMRSHYFSWKPYGSTYLWYLVTGAVYAFIFHYVLRLRKGNASHT